MSVLLCLTPAESKRLIALATAKHPAVKTALQKGNILISNGTTTGYCVQELTGFSLEIEKYPSGLVTEGVLCQTPHERIRSVMIRQGKIADSLPDLSEYEELVHHVTDMGPGDVYIKGANAIDPQGNAGFLLANPTGGNIMLALPKIYAHGVKFIIPVGLEKMIASVPEAQRQMKGINEYAFTIGRGCGYASVNNGIIIHELVAIEILTGAKAVQVSSGGVGGSEGAVGIVAEGTAQQEKKVETLLRKVKGEKPLPGWKLKCSQCTFRCRYRFKK